MLHRKCSEFKILVIENLDIRIKFYAARSEQLTNESLRREPVYTNQNQSTDMSKAGFRLNHRENFRNYI